MVIQPLSTRLIKPNFCFDLPHRRSTTVSLETRNSFTLFCLESLTSPKRPGYKPLWENLGDNHKKAMKIQNEVKFEAKTVGEIKAR